MAGAHTKRVQSYRIHTSQSQLAPFRNIHEDRLRTDLAVDISDRRHGNPQTSLEEKHREAVGLLIKRQIRLVLGGEESDGNSRLNVRCAIAATAGKG